MNVAPLLTCTLLREEKLMIIKDGTLVSFPNGDLGIVQGPTGPKYEDDTRGNPVTATNVCEVRIVFPRGVTEPRTDVPVETLKPIGQTKEKRTKDSISSATVIHFVEHAEAVRQQAADPGI